ncbi:MAG: TatD family hydrolase [Cyclobacteriaceae bacterium]|nr:TatD family hydrolase [Cyclobacteriaceae bacterium]
MTDWFVDTHCHLDLIQGIQQKYIDEDALPIKTISVTNTPSFFQHNQILFKDAQNIRIAIGMHPELVSQFFVEAELFMSILSETRYVGEIGLDGSERFRASFGIQYKIFKEIIKACADSKDKIITVHTRNAEKEAVSLLKKHLKKSECKVILHWFTGNIEAFTDAMDAGFYFSINHKMTTTKKGQELVERIPKDRLLTETDAPFTLDNKMTRLDSLTSCINRMAKILNKEPEDLKMDIFKNFHSLLL